jgi:Family of unknown function (DUF5719)
VFGAAILVLLALGVTFGTVVHSVTPVPVSKSIALSGESFFSRATYCPPSLSKTGSTARIALTSQRSQPVPVSVEPASTSHSTGTGASADAASSAAQSSPKPPQEVPPGRARFDTSERDRAVNVVGYAGAVIASAVTKGHRGAGAADCSASAGQHWYFAEGSSDLGYNERLILYNPFPDEAVARVSFLTPKGRQTKANLSDQAIPAGSTSVLRLNDFILKEPLLSLQVDAIRGRLVAWRSLDTHARKRPRGEQLSLGAPSPRAEWFLPDGAVGPGYDERIALLNPTSRAAQVTISVLTDRRTVQPPKLLDITVPPASSKSVAPAAAITGCANRVCGMGAVVTSTNDVGIVTERTIWYSTGHVQGVASEIAAPRTARRWYLGPASFAPTRDSVTVLNPTTAAASVSVTLETATRGPRSPAPLQHLKVKAGTRLEIPINHWTAGRPVIALLTSDQQVVAERFSFSRKAHDASAVMGRPLP